MSAANPTETGTELFSVKEIAEAFILGTAYFAAALAAILLLSNALPETMSPAWLLVIAVPVGIVTGMAGLATAMWRRSQQHTDTEEAHHNGEETNVPLAPPAPAPSPHPGFPQGTGANISISH